MDNESTHWDIGKIITIWAIIVGIGIFLRWDDFAVGIGLKSNEGTICVDVTSYDQNWNNDMKCTRSDGSTFYTSYDGAQKYR